MHRNAVGDESAPVKPAKKRNLDGIQYIRGAAATMVVFDHSSAMMSEAKYFGRHPFGGILETGAVGVDLFFCLSGFIIVYVALNRQLGAAMTAREFFKRRFARIIPFMWLVVVGYAILRLFGRGIFEPWSYLRALTLFPIGDVMPTPIWTLRHELLFYSIFALTFLRGKWLQYAVWVGTPLIMAVLGFDYASGVGTWHMLAAFLFNNINLLFGMGSLVGMAYLVHMDRWPTFRGAGVLVLAGVLVVYFLAYAMAYDRSNLSHILVMGPLSCLCLIVGCMVVGARDLFSRGAKLLGDASYAIYLVHTAAISTVLGIVSKRPDLLPDAAIIAINVTFAVVAGTAIHWWVERPLVARAQALLLGKRIAIGTTK